MPTPEALPLQRFDYVEFVGSVITIFGIPTTLTGST